ncbi:MAG: outer membrane protein transport protein [Bradymonadaceae bacterium]|nr:outer membrane protein transport protein [Lujinxingiaceae bacterium]
MRAEIQTSTPSAWLAASLALGLLLAHVTEARAAGFSQGMQGAASSGMAGAATARADSAEVGFYNPSAWAWHEGAQLSLGVAAIMGSITHIAPTDQARTEAITKVGLPPYFHGAYGFGQFALGLSLSVPFGSGLGWPEDWDGRFEVTSIALQAFELAPTVAWSPIEQLSLAVGPRFLSATVEYRRGIDTVNPENEGTVYLGASSRALAAQAALLYRPIDDLTFGLSYRSRADLNFTGAAHFENIPIELSQKAHDSSARTTLTLPDRWALGAAYASLWGTLSLDLEYVTWSTFDEFAIDFDDEDVPDVKQPRNWRDTLSLRVGYEYGELFPGLSLRTGFAIDPTPSPSDTLSPSQPDSDRFVVTIGAGYKLGAGLTLDLSYGHLFFSGAQPTGEAFEGRYESSANVVSAGLSFRQ